MPESQEQLFVSIVGRPNVGKSTLFNRLIGEQRVRTGDEPGVTRDRVSESVNWKDHHFTLVDTAGYDPEHPSPDPDFVVDQVRQAIDMSELVLFVTDAEVGIQPLDRKIAEELYSHSEDVLVVANKADNNQRETAANSFYELGFPRVLPVSALHKRGLSKLQDAVVERLPKQSLSRPEDLVRISLVGRPNVGKSTFFNQVLGYDRAMVDDEQGTTQDVISVNFRALDREFELRDTVGMDDRPANQTDDLLYTSMRSIHFSHVVGLVLDYNERITSQDQRLAGAIQDAYRGAIILINKSEDREEEVADRWLHHVEDRLSFFPEAPVMFTSGLEGEGVADFFQVGAEIFDEMHRRYEPKGLRNSFLELKPRISWPTGEAREVRLQTIEQIGVDPPSFQIKAINAHMLTPPDLRHLKSGLRDQLDLSHSPIKLAVQDPSLDEEAVES